MNDYDIIIIGAGPAGTSAGAYLAQKGRRVLIVDRQEFPRYVIGESMLPYCYFPLEKIGMIENIKSSDILIETFLQNALAHIEKPAYNYVYVLGQRDNSLRIVTQCFFAITKVRFSAVFGHGISAYYFS